MKCTTTKHVSLVKTLIVFSVNLSFKKKKAFVKAASLDREREREKLALVGMYDHSVLLL